MLIDKISAHTFQLTLSGIELATMISSLRWAAEGGKGELTEEAKKQLQQVLINYDRATRSIKDSTIRKIENPA